MKILSSATVYPELCSLQNELVPQPPIVNLSHLLFKCKKERNIASTLHLQTYLHKIGLETHAFLGNCLVSTLVEIGSMINAQQIFDRLLHKKKSSWESMIMGYAKCGMPKNAITLYEKMQKCEDSLHPNGHTFVSLLKSCAKIKDTERCCKIHAHIDRCKLVELDPFVGSALVDMYVKVGLLSKARQVFVALPSRDVVSWTALISGYAEHGAGKEALNCFDQMQLDGVFPNAVTFVCSLKACATIRAIEKGQEIHSEIVRKGFLESDITIGSTLVHMYAKCGFLIKAQELFNQLPSRNVVTWNALIAGYAEHGYEFEALNCFKQMKFKGIVPNPITYVCILGACGNIEATHEGQEIHAEVERKGLLESNTLIGNILVEMYVKCGLFYKARQVIDFIPARNITSWTALIKGYAEQGHGAEALICLEHMQIEGILPNASTLVHSLKACYLIGASERAEEIHDEIKRRGLLQTDQLVGNALIDLYAKHGLFIQAREVFNKIPIQSVIAWTTLISGYVDHGKAEEALECFEEMKLMNVSPNAFTFVCILKACASTRAIEKGGEIQIEIDRRGLLHSDIYIGNTLVDMYVKFGFLTQAQKVFDSLIVRDVVSWTALIGGYVEHGFSEEALSCFEKMQLDRVSPNLITFICGLKACSSIGAIDKGREIHIHIEKNGFERDIVVGNTLVNMYASCGSLTQAREVFKKLLIKDTVAWTALIAGYAQIGESRNVFSIFESMVGEGVLPNVITFVNILNACRHTVSFDKGKSYFDLMSENYGILPNREHYTCLIDLCGRIGQLENAVAMVEKLPFWSHIAMWQTLMHSCRKWGNEELGRQSFHNALCYPMLQV